MGLYVVLNGRGRAETHTSGTGTARRRGPRPGWPPGRRLIGCHRRPLSPAEFRRIRVCSPTARPTEGPRHMFCDAPRADRPRPDAKEARSGIRCTPRGQALQDPGHDPEGCRQFQQDFALIERAAQGPGPVRIPGELDVLLGTWPAAMKLPPSRVYGVATFYHPSLRSNPRASTPASSAWAPPAWRQGGRPAAGRGRAVQRTSRLGAGDDGRCKKLVAVHRPPASALRHRPRSWSTTRRRPAGKTPEAVVARLKEWL